MFIHQEDYDAENALHNTSPGLIEFYAGNVVRLNPFDILAHLRKTS